LLKGDIINTSPPEDDEGPHKEGDDSNEGDIIVRHTPPAVSTEVQHEDDNTAPTSIPPVGTVEFLADDTPDPHEHLSVEHNEEKAKEDKSGAMDWNWGAFFGNPENGDPEKKTMAIPQNADGSCQMNPLESIGIRCGNDDSTKTKTAESKTINFVFIQPYTSPLTQHVGATKEREMGSDAPKIDVPKEVSCRDRNKNPSDRIHAIVESRMEVVDKMCIPMNGILSDDGSMLSEDDEVNSVEDKEAAFGQFDDNNIVPINGDNTTLGRLESINNGDGDGPDEVGTEAILMTEMKLKTKSELEDSGRSSRTEITNNTSDKPQSTDFQKNIAMLRDMQDKLTQQPQLSYEC
jgi:hypothetical protein